MATMMRILSGIKYKDQKLGQCTDITPVANPPFVHRCTNKQAHGALVCTKHAFIVEFRDTDGSTVKAYFNGKPQAEAFRKKHDWVCTNYDIKAQGYTEPNVNPSVRLY